ncbi:MAG TPA: cupin domain-containing protein [Firmicutes bacterium]|nr:cupin domain-containing protein [Bacillota bacterium]
MYQNLFSLPESIQNGKRPDQEICHLLLQNQRIRVEKILSVGHTTPAGEWYDQDEDEFVAVLQGTAELCLEDCTVILQAGDTIWLPAHCKHRVEHTSIEPVCIWFCVFASPTP